MASLVGKKVKILSGPHAGSEGYVAYEDGLALAIEAPDLIGIESWYGMWYERKENVEVMK